MKIVISDYNPQWIERFERERALIMHILSTMRFGYAPEIAHIGSTAVPGLCAKDTIDIMIGLRHERDMDKLVTPMNFAGYTYVEKFNSIIEDRRFFIKTAGLGIKKIIRDGEHIPTREEQPRLFHVHTYCHSSDHFKRHIAFRNMLRTDEHLRNEYALLKRRLAQRDWKDESEYAFEKTEFIHKVESRAYSMPEC